MMNIFFIPSWYPSANQTLPGIFFREQAQALTKIFPDMNIGISTWGQNDDRMLLWARQPFSSFKKMLTNVRMPSTQNKLKANLVEYTTPRFTWTSRLLRGNMKRIIQANESNLHQFASEYGQPDLIHAHVGYPAGYIARAISDATGIPYMITEQMSPFPYHYFLSKGNDLIPRLKDAYSTSKANIAISESLAQKMKSFGVERVQVIPNLVDESFFAPPSNAISNEQFTFFCHGRIVRQKGIDILLKAFSSIRHNAILRIGGAGEELVAYQRLSKDLGIAHNVQWLGELDKQEALAEYQRCNAFVLPSRHETMGVVFVEAMACGKPVIGTICGGPEEFINEDNGILIPAEDVDGLQNAMERMIWHSVEYDPQKIRSIALSRFSAKTVCEKIRALYQNIVDVKT